MLRRYQAVVRRCRSARCLTGGNPRTPPPTPTPTPRMEDMLGRLVSSSELAAKKSTKVNSQNSRPAVGAATGNLASSLSQAFKGSTASPGRTSSPFRQLIQNLEKNGPSATGSISSNISKGKVTAQKVQSNVRPATMPASLGHGSASVRDSFRRAESLRINSPPISHQPTAKSVLDSFSSALPNQLSSTAPDTEVPEVTSGELRYQQHQERLKHQREKFNRSVPKLPEAPYIRNAQRLPGMETRNSQPAPNSPRAVSVSGSYAEETAEVKTVRENFPSQDSTQFIEISELKRRMADKLSREKVATNSPSLSTVRSDTKKKNSTTATTAQSAAKQKGTVVKEVSVPTQGLTIRNLSQRLSTRVSDLLKTLTNLGEEVDENNEDLLIEADVCELVVLEMGLGVKREEGTTDANQLTPSLAAAAAVGTSAEIALKSRAPIVCVMGHVDHGKTTLLDTLRKANVAAGEAGGITQKLSAFSVEVSGRQVVFLDTPGHAAFSKMRSHGAEATDLVVLVVALDDGVRPQTREALRVAKEAKCTILVALNKVDKIADPIERKAARTRVLSQLAEENLLVEEFGGDIMTVEVSGKTGVGIDRLVEGLLLQADVLELKAAGSGHAEATVLDAYMEKGRGVVADVLVRWGSLSVGDPIVVDTMYGRVKAMVDDAGNSITTAGPSTPVRLLGLRTVPTAGQELLSVVSETKARQISERRRRLQELKLQRQQELQQSTQMLAAAPITDSTTPAGDGLEQNAAEEARKSPHISVLLKADGVGTLEALEQVVKGLSERTSDVTITVADSSVGDVTRSDVERSFTVGNALILAFNVGLADSATRASAKEHDVKIVRDTVIYRLEDALRLAMQTQMPKERSLVREGTARVQKVFSMRDKAGTSVAGLLVQSGFLRTGSSSADIVYKITRQNGDTVLEEADGSSAVLKRLKDTVHKVEQGTECGLQLGKFKDWAEDDLVECYRVEWSTKDLNIISAASGSLPSSKLERKL